MTPFVGTFAAESSLSLELGRPVVVDVQRVAAPPPVPFAVEWELYDDTADPAPRAPLGPGRTAADP